jgi:hypothetical protein
MLELHEQFSRGHQKVEHASNRRFGLVVGAIVLLIGCIRAYIYDNFGTLDGTLAASGIALMVAAVVWPSGLSPLNHAWSRLGLLLHKVTNPLILGLMFAVAIVPTGLIMRAFGSDPMARRLDAHEDYWTKRSTPGSTSETLQQPF